MDIHRGYRYRCYPTAEQVALLDDWQGKQRFLWNLANAQYEHAYSRCRADRWRLPSAVGQIYELTTLREMLPWLRDVPRDVQNQLLIELNLAWQRFVKGIAGRPQFKCKSKHRAPVIAPQDYRLEGEGRRVPQLQQVQGVEGGDRRSGETEAAQVEVGMLQGGRWHRRGPERTEPTRCNLNLR